MWVDKRANFATTEEEKNVTYLLGCTYMSSITKKDCLGNTTSHKNSQICDSAYDDLKQAAERNLRGWGKEEKKLQRRMQHISPCLQKLLASVREIA